MGARSTQADQHDLEQSKHTHTAPHTRNAPTENRLCIFTRIRMAIFFDTMLGNTRGRSISSEAVLRHGQTGPAESKHVILHPYREKKNTPVPK